MPTSSFVVFSFDLETTGLSIYYSQITQFGISATRVTIDDENKTTTYDRDLPTFSEYVKCTCAIDAEAARITGITMDTLKDASPLSIVLHKAVIYVDTVANTGEDRILTGYNIFKFDVPILVADIRRNLSSFEKGATVVDTLKKFKFMSAVDLLVFMRNHVDKSRLTWRANGTCCFGLGQVHMALLGRGFDNAHDALADTEAVLNLICEDQGCTPKKLQMLVVSNDADAYCVNIMRSIGDIDKNLATREKKLKEFKESRQQSVAEMFERKSKKVKTEK